MKNPGKIPKQLRSDVISRIFREIFDDRLTKVAGIIFVLIVALVIFNFYSDLPEKYPAFGVFNYSMVPVLFVAGGVVFVLALLRLSSSGDDDET